MDDLLLPEIAPQSTCAEIIDRHIKRRFPVITWLPYYQFGVFLQDVLAGFTVGLTEIPQGIAYAVVAGLEPQYGLYSGFMGCFMYFLFGTCKDLNIGPTAIMSLMILPHVEKLGPDMAVLITFLGGIIVFVLGLAKLGFLVEFFSYPIIAGFTSAAAIQIASSQIKGLLGISGRADGFLEAWETVLKHIGEVRLWDSILGVVSIIVLIAMKEMGVFGTRKNRPEWSGTRNFFGKCIWLVSLGRNAIVVIIGTGMAYAFSCHGLTPFKLTGKVGEGLPTFQLPPFSTTFQNKTYDFNDMITQYGSSIAFIPLVSILEHVAIAKAFANGKLIDASQEMLANGICNIMSSFFRSMPTTGSFTRTAVNNASGVQTPFGGIITGTMVLLALGLLTSTFYFIPKATLAAVVITAMIYLCEFGAIGVLWKSKKMDLVPFGITFLLCLLLGLEYGILIGIASNLIFVMYESARPTLGIEREKIPQGDIFIVTPKQGLHFPSAEYIREKIMIESNVTKSVVVINGIYISNIDATVAKNFTLLARDLVKRGQKIVFWNFEKSVVAVCLGLDVDLKQYFREGSLEDVVDDPTLDRISRDLDFTIQ